MLFIILTARISSYTSFNFSQIDTILVFIMQAWLVQLYYKFSTYLAGHTKRSLVVDNHGSAAFSYTEKGTRNVDKPSIVFVHGLSSNKETWIPIIKNILASYHVITVDLPGHGETIGFNEDTYSIEKFVEKLKLFFDKMNLTQPMCIIGASMGGAIVCIFAMKYPEYVSMICLLAPIANEECETDLIRQLRDGSYNALLPETPEQLRHMINTLTVKRMNLPKPFLNGFLHLRLRLIEEHRKVLRSLLEHDYPLIEHHYQQLRQLDRPALILWGREDRVYKFDGAQFFCKLLPNAQSVIFDDCGHFMAIDKPEETARSILDFYNINANYQRMGSASSIDRQPSCPYSRMCAEEIKKAKNTRYINGEASDFYHLCSDGKTDQIREILENSDRKHIDELVKREANGDTALHVAAEKGHNEIVKLLLEHRCCRTIRNHTGRLAIEMASNEDTKRLFIRPEGSDRFHDLDSTNTIAHYLPEKKKETDENEVNALEYVQRFKTEEEIYEYSLNHQTTAMWLRFFNWFSRTFPSLLQQDFLKPDSFDLDKNKDFDNFLKTKAGQYYNRTRSEFHEAYERNSIEPYLTIYSRETHGFYRLLNKQLADSASEADTSPHLCDRFIIEFHIRSDELKGRAFRGIVYRGATMDLKDIKPYEEDCEHKQRGVILFRAFTSTSIDRNVAFDFIRLNPPASHQRAVLFVIDIKTKSPTIIGMADKSDHPEEKEILILPGNLFIVKEIRKDVTHTIKKKTMTITEIHLEYLHIPVSFLKKLKHTLHSARRDNLTA